MFFVAALKQLVCPFQPSGTRTGGREGGLLSSTDPQAADTHSQLLVRSMAFQLHFVLKARVWTQAEVESSPHSQPASELRLRAVWGGGRAAWVCWDYKSPHVGTGCRSSAHRGRDRGRGQHLVPEGQVTRSWVHENRMERGLVCAGPHPVAGLWASRARPVSAPETPGALRCGTPAPP